MSWYQRKKLAVFTSQLQRTAHINSRKAIRRFISCRWPPLRSHSLRESASFSLKSERTLSWWLEAAFLLLIHSATPVCMRGTLEPSWILGERGASSLHAVGLGILEQETSHQRGGNACASFLCPPSLILEQDAGDRLVVHVAVATFGVMVTGRWGIS